MITSPLKRAKQTAEIINQALHLPLIEMNDFSERDFGDAEGMTLEEIRSAFPDRNYPNKEDGSSFRNRIMAGLNKINQQYSGSEVLLVTHGAVINSLFAFLSNGEMGREKLKLMNASISNIHFHEEQWKIKEFNQISHLSMYN